LEALRGRELADLVVVVAAVQAQALRALRCRDRARDRSGGQGGLQQLHVVAVGAVVCQPDRDPCCLAENRTFRPLLARSVGFGPVFAPPSGALVIAPSAARNDQSIPTTLSYSNSPWRGPRPPATCDRRRSTDDPSRCPGAPTKPGTPTGVWATRERMRQAERELAQQAEASYQRTVRDWQAARPKTIKSTEPPAKVGASVTPGRA
jgi:hypothetical protein